jgi:hypothetical protein
MSMEALEGRALLANVSAVYNLATFDLRITAPDANDKFAIKEASAAAGGQVTVSSLAGSTVINGFPFPSTTLGPVRTLEVFVTGPNGTADVITLTGAGKTVPTTVVSTSFTIGGGDVPSPTSSTGVTLSVNNVDSAGPFTLFTNGQLALTVDNSTFSSLLVDEDSTCPCPATVELGNDTIAGTVNVQLGAANGDTILLQNGDKFGSTFLMEGNGNMDKITVLNAQVKDLDMEQGNGNTDSITVNTVKVSLTSFGVFASQGNGGPTFDSKGNQIAPGDSISINAVTVLGTTPPLNILSPSSGFPGIVTIQGNGNQATTLVSNSIVPGEISETQGNGNSDVAQVLGSTTGFIYTPINSGTVANPTTIHSPIIINQGNGNNDVARVANSTAFGDIRVNQNPPASGFGNGNGDLVEILSDIIGFIGATGNINSGDSLLVNLGNGNNDVVRVLDTVVAGNIDVEEGNGDNDLITLLGTHAGSTVAFGPGGVLDVFGEIELEQGNGAQDVVTVGSTAASGITVANNLEISQGLGLGGTACCTPIPGDTVNLNDAAITSNIDIVQGEPVNTDPDTTLPLGGNGGNTVNIGTTSPVSAGGATSVTQGGSNNTVVLGGAGSTTGPDFITTFLDINTGAGNGFVTATNTTVVVGSFLGNDFVIDGGGSGNVFSGLSDPTNSGVTISGNYFGF